MPDRIPPPPTLTLSEHYRRPSPKLAVTRYIYPDGSYTWSAHCECGLHLVHTKEDPYPYLADHRRHDHA